MSKYPPFPLFYLAFLVAYIGGLIALALGYRTESMEVPATWGDLLFVLMLWVLTDSVVEAIRDANKG